MSSIIEQLIAIKEATSSGDILTMMDECILYSKLSRSKKLGYVTNSLPLQKKLPYITRATKGSVYELSLFALATDVMRHLRDEVPDCLQEILDNVPDRRRKQLMIAQDGAIDVTYHAMATFQFTMEPDIVAVYTDERGDTSRALIIVHANNKYRIYQGEYIHADVAEDDEQEDAVQIPKLTHYDYVTPTHTIRINTYSSQGNNAYFFGELHMDNIICHLMLPSNDVLWLSALPTLEYPLNPESIVEIPLTILEQNTLNMSTHHVDNFARALSNVVTRWEASRK